MPTLHDIPLWLIWMMLKCVELMLLKRHLCCRVSIICNVSADHARHNHALIQFIAVVRLQVLIHPSCLLPIHTIEIIRFIDPGLRDLYHTLFEVCRLRHLMTLPLKAGLRFHYPRYQCLLIVFVMISISILHHL